MTGTVNFHATCPKRDRSSLYYMISSRICGNQCDIELDKKS